MKIFLYLLPILFLTGCINNGDHTNSNFGYRYGIDDAGEYPIISNDSIKVKVFYGGCNPGHEFTLQHHKLSPVYSEVWLFKTTPDQRCEAAFDEILSFQLPPEAFQSQHIFLIGPGDTRILVDHKR